MTKQNHPRVYRELRKQGATPAQATMYCNLVAWYVDLSQQDCVTEVHHILPRNCGWWKRHANARWNRAVVSWQLHTSLHAALCYIFPANEALFKAAKITSRTCRATPQAQREKTQMIQWYGAGKSCVWIAKRIGVCAKTVHHRLRRWGTPMRTQGQSLSISTLGTKKRRFQNRAVAWYTAGKSMVWIGKRIGVGGWTIGHWLRERKVKLRSQGEARSLAKLGDKPQRYKIRVIAWYAAGKTPKWIGQQCQVEQGTIRKWLCEYGVPMRPLSEAAQPVHLRMKKKTVSISHSRLVYCGKIGLLDCQTNRNL